MWCVGPCCRSNGQVLLHGKYLELLRATNALRRTRNDLIQSQPLDKSVFVPLLFLSDSQDPKFRDTIAQMKELKENINEKEVSIHIFLLLTTIRG